MVIAWLEQTAADVPPESDWLSAAEAECLCGMRIPKRRADWRLGRWTAKRAVATHLALPDDARSLQQIEVRAASSGAPEAFLAGRPAGVAISLSHSSGLAACAVTLPGVELGCDLEVVEPRSEAFISDYFTTEERALIAKAPAAERLTLVALIWSAKESALKALQVGLRADTRSALVALRDAPPYGEEAAPGNKDPLFLPAVAQWRPLSVRVDSRDFPGWWQQAGTIVRTMVAIPPPDPPVLLQVARPRGPVLP